MFWLLYILPLFFPPKEAKPVKPSFKAYYFPVAKLVEPKVYVYHNANHYIEYWHLETKITGKDTFFYMDFYDKEFQLLQKKVEQYTDSGMVILDADFVFPDMGGKQFIADCEVHAPMSFHFDDTKNPFLSKLQYQDINGIQYSHAYKQQHLPGNQHVYTFNKRERRCILIGEETTDEVSSSSQSTYTYYQEHLYARNIGLVKSQFRGNFDLPGRRLMEIISVQEFKRRKKE